MTDTAGPAPSTPDGDSSERDRAPLATYLLKAYGVFVASNAVVGAMLALADVGACSGVKRCALLVSIAAVICAVVGQLVTPLFFFYMLVDTTRVVSHDVVARDVIPGPILYFACMLFLFFSAHYRRKPFRRAAYASLVALTLGVGVNLVGYARQGAL